MGVQRKSMVMDRMLYTVYGFFSYNLDRFTKSKRLELQQKSSTEKPHLLFSFWYAPSSGKAKRLMEELQERFEGSSFPIGVSVFVRPMGDIDENNDYSYDSNTLESFLEASETTGMPVLIVTSGMHWTEAAYNKSPLIRMLEGKEDTLMKFEDGTHVKRKLQPPGNLLPIALLRILSGMDNNGVVYLSHRSPEVIRYRERNLRQMAQVVAAYAERCPGLFVGISAENEVDFPGVWITGGKKVDCREYDKSKERTVESILKGNINIFLQAGLPEDKIYTNQSVEDAENRASPLSTANITHSHIGITAWGTGNEELYRKTSALARQEGKRWALVVTNPLSRDYNKNLEEIRTALKYSPDLINFYNWWEHFWGYGIRGMPLERVIKAL